MATLLTDLDPRLRSRKKIGRRRIFAVAGQIGGKQVVQLVLTQAPIGEQYTETEIDFTGLIITAEFSDETSEVVNATPDIMIWGSESVPQTVTFSYGGKTVEWTTTPTLTVPTSLAVTGSWTNKQIEGRPVDTTGLSFTAIYNNGETKTVTPEVSPSIWSGTGIQTATFSYTYNGVTVTTTSEVYVREMKYVGTLVKSNASGTEKYITSVFYGQKASSLSSSSVKYEFYYTNDNGATFTSFYSVNAKDIVDGNGNTSGSTAMAINTAIQAEITAGRATSSSVIYYEVIDTENEYQSNSDAYASFYMYISGNSGVNVKTDAYGSTFGYISLGSKNIMRENITGAGTYPTGWNISEDFTKFTLFPVKGEYFRTGRADFNILMEWLNGTGSSYYNNYFTTGVDNRFTAWQLMKLANDTDAQYNDWFIPSIGELEQMRLTFGETQNGEVWASSLHKEYFGKGVLGNNYFNGGVGVTRNGTFEQSTSTASIENFWIWGLSGDRDAETISATRNQYGRNMAIILVRTF